MSKSSPNFPGPKTHALTQDNLLQLVTSCGDQLELPHTIITTVFGAVLAILGDTLITTDWLYSPDASTLINALLNEEAQKAAFLNLQAKFQLSESPDGSPFSPQNQNPATAPDHLIVQRHYTTVERLTASLYPDSAHALLIVMHVMDFFEIAEMRTYNYSDLPALIHQTSKRICDGQFTPLDSLKHGQLYSVTDSDIIAVEQNIVEYLQILNLPGIQPDLFAARFLSFYSTTVGTLNNLLDYPNWEAAFLLPAIESTLDSRHGIPLGLPPHDPKSADQNVAYAARGLRPLWPDRPTQTIEQLVQQDLLLVEEPRFFGAVILSSFTDSTPHETLMLDVAFAMANTGLQYKLQHLATGLTDPDSNPDEPTIVSRDQIAGTFSIIIYLSRPYLTNPRNEVQYIDGERINRRATDVSHKFIQLSGKTRPPDSHTGPAYARHYTATCIYTQSDIPHDSDIILLVVIGLGRTPTINNALATAITLTIQDITDHRIQQAQIKTTMDLRIVNHKVTVGNKTQNARLNSYNLVVRVPATTTEEDIQHVHTALQIRHGAPPARVQLLGHQLAITTGLTPTSMDTHLITVNQPSLQIGYVPPKMSHEQFSRLIHTTLDSRSCTTVLPWLHGTYILLSDIGHPITEVTLSNADFQIPESNPRMAFVETHTRAQATYKNSFLSSHSIPVPEKKSSRINSNDIKTSLQRASEDVRNSGTTSQTTHQTPTSSVHSASSRATSHTMSNPLSSPTDSSQYTPNLAKLVTDAVLQLRLTDSQDLERQRQQLQVDNSLFQAQFEGYIAQSLANEALAHRERQHADQARALADAARDREISNLYSSITGLTALLQSLAQQPHSPTQAHTTTEASTPVSDHITYSPPQQSYASAASGSSLVVHSPGPPNPTASKHPRSEPHSLTALPDTPLSPDRETTPKRVLLSQSPVSTAATAVRAPRPPTPATTPASAAGTPPANQGAGLIPNTQAITTRVESATEARSALRTQTK
jgi:hypothetical protein